MFLVAILALVLIYLFYKWSISTFDYFEKQNIPFRKPYPLVGTNGNMITNSKSLMEMMPEFYNEFENEK